MNVLVFCFLFFVFCFVLFCFVLFCFVLFCFVFVCLFVCLFVLSWFSSLSLQAVDSTKLWGVTWTRIDQFLPGFLKDLFPNVTPPPLPPPSPPSPPPSSQSPPPIEQVDSSTTSPDSLPTASSPLPVSQSPARSPDRSPQASPPSSSPGNSALCQYPHLLHKLHKLICCKICTRTYLDGGGLGQGTHLLLFLFLIMTHYYPDLSVRMSLYVHQQQPQK